ncbi:DNA repair protein RecO [Bifidobacterium bombi]|uniref:DNA repair protein RecO n=1 Tax=Bifidobacterium bombi DSM 19703 TaxID=1341695 RepID=A0A080N255_9BIFI|nr:DNA repair protein RecO [Bifidobacterium bombi]KFF31013.1 DNA repair protein RecO [Bifidobacterium bombi DSM 19703]
MALFRDEGIVLRTVKLGEADRIVTLLTRGHGKVRAVAKGVRRVKSRFGSRVEPFMRCNMLIAGGRSLDVISQAALIAPYGGPICADYAAYEAASMMVETIDKLVSTEHEPVGAQYMLLVSALHSLASHKHGAQVIGNSYVMRSLALAGWKPRTDSCVVCMRRDGLDYFSVAAGGVMCVDDHTPDSRYITLDERERLQALIDGDWKVLDGAALPVGTRHLVEEWCEYYLERPIRSMKLQES